MEIVTIRFTTKWPPNLTSPIIAFFGGSKMFSHCMTIIDGLAYEATMLHGCRVVPVDVAMEGVAFYLDMFIEVEDVKSMIDFGNAQDGKGYDYGGAFGIPFLASDDWSDSTKWWCSELCFMQLGAAGVWLLDPSEQKRVTPNDLLQCNFHKTEVKSYGD